MATTARVSRRALLTASAATLAGTAVVAAPLGLLRLLPDLLAALALVAGCVVLYRRRPEETDPASRALSP